MVSVIQVYEAVRDLCNKDQKGFITPAVFNRFASLAQQNIFNEMFNELKIATKLRRAGSDAGRDKSAYKAVEEDLNYFISQVTLNVADEEGIETITDIDGNPIDVFIHETAIHNLPSNVARVINMTVVDSGAAVEIIYDSEKLERVLKSNLSAPTEDFPVALVNNRSVEIFPVSISSDVQMRYYRNPSSIDSDGLVDTANQPKYSSTSISQGFVIADPGSCLDFELPRHYFPEIVGEIARMIGVRLRDNVISQYGVSETNSK